MIISPILLGHQLFLIELKISNTQNYPALILPNTFTFQLLFRVDFYLLSPFLPLYWEVESTKNIDVHICLFTSYSDPKQPVLSNIKWELGIAHP